MTTETRNEAAATNTTRYESLSQRLVARSIRVDSGCRMWLGPKIPAGYGSLMVKGKTELAHRLAYEQWVGPIPSDKQIDHLCRRRDCIEPTHLELVTSRENTLRGTGVTAVNAAKTHCPQGHEYTPENTRVRRGRRHCRECDLEYKRTVKAKAYEQGVADGRRATMERIERAYRASEVPDGSESFYRGIDAASANLFAILREEAAL